MNFTSETRVYNIGCPVHGYFNQRPADRLNGHGCPRCHCSICGSNCKVSFPQGSKVYSAATVALNSGVAANCE
jgi:hypothetical protein